MSTKEALLEAHKQPIEHDPTWTGVVHSSDRKWQDVMFAIIFIVFLGVLFGVGGWSIHNRDMSASQVATADDWYSKAISFLNDHGQLLGIAAGVSCGMGLVWLVLLILFSKVILYISLFLGVCGLGAAGAYLITFNSPSMIVAGVVVCVIDLLLICILIYMRKKIALSAMIIREACKGVVFNPSVFFIASVIILVFSAFVAFVLVAYVSLSYFAPSSDGVLNRNAEWVGLFFLFGAFWGSMFLCAVLQMCVSGAVATWYFGRSGTQSEGSPALRMLGLALTKSLGALAFGSLVLAVIAFVNYCIAKARAAAGANIVAKIILACLQCLCCCCMSIVETINGFAYVYIAMYGHGFCGAGKACFHLIGRNPASTLLVEAFSGFLLWMGKLAGTAAATIITVEVMSAQTGVDVELGISTIIVILLSYAIMTYITAIVGVAVDAVLVCYCEDLERNSELQRYLMDPDIHAHVQDMVKQQQKAQPAPAPASE